MRSLCFTLVVASTIAFAQSTPQTFFVKSDISRIRVETSLRVEPPSSALAGKFSASSRERSITSGPGFYSRILLDRTNHTYFGYELLIEQQRPGEYLATFGKLGVTPLDLAAGSAPIIPPTLDNSTKPPGSSQQIEWTMLTIPEIPKPRVIHAGDSTRIDLFVDSASGEKLFDEIRVTETRSPRVISQTAVPPVPTASGTARDFTVRDVELQIVRPRITLNKRLQEGQSWREVRGALVWLYFPDHGRYILSLLPRPDLGFKKAGEVRGGVLSFAVDDDTVRLECLTPLASGDAAYNLYVLHDDNWEPTGERQKGSLGIGTVSEGELVALKHSVR